MGAMTIITLYANEHDDSKIRNNAVNVKNRSDVLVENLDD